MVYWGEGRTVVVALLLVVLDDVELDVPDGSVGTVGPTEHATRLTNSIHSTRLISESLEIHLKLQVILYAFLYQ